MLYMYEHKRSQRAATRPKNDLYQGIENAVYICLVRNFQKEQKRARILNTHNDLAYKSIENVGYISCQKRYKDQKLFKNSNTMT